MTALSLEEIRYVKPYRIGVIWGESLAFLPRLVVALGLICLAPIGMIAARSSSASRTIAIIVALVVLAATIVGALWIYVDFWASVLAIVVYIIAGATFVLRDFTQVDDL